MGRDAPILTYKFTDLVAFGGEHSTLGDVARRVAQHAGRTLPPDPEPDQGLFARTDSYSFVKAGIPSLFLHPGPAGAGKAASATYYSDHYHQPSDDLAQPLDWEAAANFVQLNFDIVRAIADERRRPAWRRGDYFGALLEGAASTSK